MSEGDSSIPKHRADLPATFGDLSIAYPSQAKCRCDKDGPCPRHDPLGYTDEGRHCKGRW